MQSGGIIEHAWGDGCEFGLVREAIVRDDFLMGLVETSNIIVDYIYCAFRYKPDGHCHGSVRPGFDPNSVYRQLKWNISDEVSYCYFRVDSCLRLRIVD